MRQLPPPQPPDKVGAFVWVRHNGKLWPQKWFQPFLGFDLGERVGQWLIAYPMDQTLADMPIDTLVTLFPAPAQEGPGSRFAITPALVEPEPEEPTHEPRS